MEISLKMFCGALVFFSLIILVISVSCESNNFTNVDYYQYKNVPVINCGCNEEIVCLRKCCRPGFYLTKGYCLRGNSTVFRVPVRKSGANNSGTVVNFREVKYYAAGVMDCPFYVIRLDESVEEFFYLRGHSSLFIYPEERVIEHGEFCIDEFHYENYTGLATLICFPGELVKRKVKEIGMIISIPFLLATIIVYCLLPERNLHMKTLMCYVTNLMFAYILLVTIQLGHAFSDTSCSIIGFLCLFLFTSSIFWMNIICLDIFLTFSGYFGIQGNKHKENRRLFYYSIYGLLAPCALIFTTFMVNKYGDPSKNYHPSIGNGICFLKDGLPYLLYFHGPVGALLCANVVLFTLTALKIRQAKKETKVLKKGENRKSNENDKKRFNLYIKLLLAMGINWAMETISWACEQYTDIPKAIWYLTDFCNALYGVVIFVLFAWKKRHWKILKKKYYTLIGRPHLAQSMSTTQNTRTTMSMSVSDTPTNGETMRLSSVN